jgi:hypothetical protein
MKGYFHQYAYSCCIIVFNDAKYCFYTNCFDPISTLFREKYDVAHNDGWL